MELYMEKRLTVKAENQFIFIISIDPGDVKWIAAASHLT